MTAGTECIGAGKTVLRAAQKMTDLGVGALPICGTDNKLKGMLTDRDIVVKVLGAGQEGQQVVFDVTQDPKGLQAENITPA
jgi:CBS domain-containing protein